MHGLGQVNMKRDATVLAFVLSRASGITSPTNIRTNFGEMFVEFYPQNGTVCMTRKTQPHQSRIHN